MVLFNVFVAEQKRTLKVGFEIPENIDWHRYNVNQFESLAASFFWFDPINY